jgi:thymidylate synthase ThyX
MRLTTMEIRYPRFVHSEFMTHRAFSRNASSSRAIPLAKMIAEAETDSAWPVYWGANQKGMQAAAELEYVAKCNAMMEWDKARLDAIAHAKRLGEIGLHKQLATRILEPWLHITVLVTGTADAYANFFNLRNHPDAQPEIQALAKEMLAAYTESLPVVRLWHLPYVSEEERSAFSPGSVGNPVLLSVARCARVSYLNHDGTDCDPAKDAELAKTLIQKKHMSPTEHQALAADPAVRSGNFVGWVQHRKTIEGEYQDRYPGVTNDLTSKS